MKNLLCFFLISGLGFFIPSKAQTEPVQQVTKKILYYTFSGPQSAAELEELKKDVLLIKDVKEVKSECKQEKKTGQLRIIYLERKRTKEGDKDFDITEVKKLILKYNFTPGDFKIEDPE